MVGSIARVLSSGRSVLGYRMASVVLCALVLGHAFARSRRFGASAWLVAALTPSAWFLIGVVGTSGIEIALVVLALVEAVGRFRQPLEESLSRVTVPLAACLLIRPEAVIDVAVVALVLAPTIARPITRRNVAHAGDAIRCRRCRLGRLESLDWIRVRRSAYRRHEDGPHHDRPIAEPNPADGSSGRRGTRVERVLCSSDRPTGLGSDAGSCGMAGCSPSRLIGGGTFGGRSPRWPYPRSWTLIVHRQIGSIWQGRYSIVFAIGGVLYAARCAPPSRAVMRALVIAGATAEVLTLVAFVASIHGRPRRLPPATPRRRGPH